MQNQIGSPSVTRTLSPHHVSKDQYQGRTCAPTQNSETIKVEPVFILLLDLETGLSYEIYS